MSNNIDERVVEMRFDNDHFEKNVNQTMSSIDKLKSKLDFEGATKGLESIDSAAKKVNITPLATAAESVRLKFSALEVMAVTALQNITNSAINAGKRIVSSLTIEPVTTGFNEYELKMNSIQTIMAGTGADLETVNRYLNELNEYSDKTIYSFADMTQNIGKFTNAGVKLEDAVKAIQGVSNEAAVSGANANEASRAMYNFAQALSAGYVKLIDWKSIENANMATVEFKNELIKTAVALGTVSDAGDGLYKTLDGNTFNATTRFNEVFQDQWMTSEVLIETLKKYADETTDIGKKATEAATKVKTFTMLLDTLKEAAQSGWAQTWEIIVGDFEEARTLFTKISDVVGGIIGKAADARNSLLKGALGSKWDTLKEKITGLGIDYDDFQEKLKETARQHGVSIDKMIENEGSLEATMKHGWLTSGVLTETISKYTEAVGVTIDETDALAESLTKFGDIVDQVIVGNFGNGEERIKLLTEAGHDYATIQNLVNHVLGATTDELKKKTEEELKSLGLTEEQIRALRSLAEEAEKSGTEVNELISQLYRPSGRELLIDTFKNALKGLGQVITAVSQAWTAAFPPMTSEQLYGIIETINKFSKNLVLSEEGVGQLRRTFDGLIAVIDIFTTLTGGVAKTAFKILAEALGLVDMPILELTARIGDAISGFRDWLFESSIFAKAFDAVVKGVATGIKMLKDWFDSFKALPETQEKIKNFKEAFTGALSKFKGLLVKVSVGVVDLGKKLVSGIKNLKSWFDEWRALPSTQENFEKFKAALIKGLTKFKDLLVNGAKAIWNFGKKLVEGIKNLKDWFDAWKATPEAQKFFDNLGGAYTKAITAFNTLIQNGVAKLKEIGAGFVAGVKKVKAWIDEFKAIPGVQKNLDKFKDGVTYLLNIIKGSFTVCKDSVKEFIDNIKSLDSLTFKDILNEIKKFINKLKSHFTSAGGSFMIITNALRGLSEEVKIKLGETWKGFDKFLDQITGFGKSIKERIGKIDLGGILLAALGIGTLTIGSKIGDALEALTAPLAGFGELLKGLATQARSVQGVLKATKFTLLASGFAAMAAGIILLAGAVALLTLVDQNKLWSAVGAMAVLGGVLAALAAAMAAINKGISNVVANTTSIILLASSVLVLVIALKTLDTLNPDRLLANVLTLGTIMGALFAVAMALSKQAPTLFSGSAALIAFAAATLLLVNALKDISGLSSTNIMESVVVLVGIMSALALVTRICQSVGGWSAVSMLATVLALKVLIGTLDDMAKINLKTIESSIGSFIVIFAMIAVLIASTKLAGEHAAKAGVAILAISASLILMVTALKQLAKMDPSAMIAPIAAMGALMLMIAGVIASTTLAGQNSLKAGAMLLMMAGALTIVALIAVILSKVDPAGLWRGVAAIVALEACFAGLIAVTQFARAFKGVQSMLITLTVVVGILAVALVALSSLNRKDVLSATTALASVMGTFAVLLLTVSKMQTISTKSLVTIGVLTAVVAAFAGLIYLLGDVEPGTALAIAGSLSVLLLALSAACVILSTMKTVSTSGLINIGILTLVVAALGGILYLLRDLDPESTIATATGLSAMILALSGACAILTVAGAAAGPALIGIGVLAALIAAMGLLMAAIGALVTDFPQISDWLDTAIPVLEKIGYGIGSFVGSIVGGFSAGALSGLPEIANHLSNFMTNLKPFFDGLKSVNSELLSAALSLVGIVLALTATNFINQISSFLLGKSDMTEFATQLTALGAGIVGFSKIVEGNVDADSVATAANAGKLLTELADTVPNTGGLLGFIVGNNDISVFAAQLPVLAMGIRDFSAIVKDNVDANAVETAANAGKLLTELANTVPNTGGLLGFIVGNNDIGVFAAQLPILATGIVAFSKIVSECGIDTDAVKTAAYAGKVLVELADTVPNTGGLLGFIVGNNDIGVFAAQLPILAGGIVAFSKIVAGNIDTDAVTTAANAGKVLVELSDTVPNTGGLLGFITGNNDIAVFAAQLPVLATGIVAFSKIVAGNIDTRAVETAAHAGKVLVELSDTVPNTGGLLGFITGSNTKIPMFASQLPILAAGIRDFALIVKGNVDTKSVETAANAGKLLSDLGSYVNQSKTGGIFSFLIGGNMATFGSQLGLLGDGIVAFSTKVKGKVDAKSVEAATNAGTLIATLSTNVTESTGNWLYNLFGGNNNKFKNFKEQMPMLGEAIVAFSNSISGKINSSAVTSAKIVGDVLSTLMSSMDSTDINEMGNFNKKLSELGDAIRKYYTDITGVNTTTLRSIMGVLNTAVSDIIRWTTDANTNKMGWFGLALSTLGNKIDGYYDALVAIKPDKFTKALDVVERLINQTLDMSTVDTSGVDEFASSLENLGKYGISAFVKAFENSDETIKNAANHLMNTFTKAASDKTNSVSSTFKGIIDTVIADAVNGKYNDFKLAGTNLITALGAGISSENSITNVKNSIGTITKSAIDKLKHTDTYNSFKSAGEYLVKGFASGIDSSTSKEKVEVASKTIARTAIRGLNEELQINSPSKVAYESGEFTGMGLVNALADYADKSYDAGANLAESARMGLRKAISKVVDTLNGDIDTEPTIRPVLDLSNVESGARRLNTLFARDQVMSINVGRHNNFTEDQNGETSRASGNVYNYTQNNYSPKALSRIDIYRQTKNQFSAMERKVEA